MPALEMRYPADLLACVQGVDAGACTWFAAGVQAALGAAIYLGAVVTVVYLLIQNARDKARRRERLCQALLEHAQDVVVDGNGRAKCTVRGLPVRFAFTSHGSGSSAESWTEVEVDVLGGLLVLALRPQGSRTRELARDGLKVDIEAGDPAFDEKYVVEGAPAAVVKSLLSRALCEEIMALAVDELAIVKRDSGGSRIQLGRRGWKQGQADIHALVDLAVRIAEGIAPAMAAVREAEAPQPQSAYRGAAATAEAQQKWQSAKGDLSARQETEVRTLEAMQRRRLAGHRMHVSIIIVVLATAFVTMWIYHLTHP